jgi:hypothetical protein
MTPIQRKEGLISPLSHFAWLPGPCFGEGAMGAVMGNGNIFNSEHKTEGARHVNNGGAKCYGTVARLLNRFAFVWKLLDALVLSNVALESRNPSNIRTC